MTMMSYTLAPCVWCKCTEVHELVGFAHNPFKRFYKGQGIVTSNTSFFLHLRNPCVMTRFSSPLEPFLTLFQLWVILFYGT
jgi:hypothetical protein